MGAQGLGLTTGSYRIRIGTRGSLLARTQTEWVAAQLRAHHPHIEIEIVVIETTGDLRRDMPFAAIGTKGMFVKEIELALLDGSIDLAVHSLKDMPSEQPPGLVLACVPMREDARDALLTRTSVSLEKLHHGARIGTSSVRRQAQLRHVRPDLQVVELRGNLDTRLRKLDNGDYDAIVLACAGLHRLGLAHRISQPLPVEICVPAVGQGALALETRDADSTVRSLLAQLHDMASGIAIEAERGFQSALGGGCTVPAGAYAMTGDGTVQVRAAIASPDGAHLLSDSQSGPQASARILGIELAQRLLALGGNALLGREQTDR
jgi:hydroxymethylbilane synthase